MFWKLLFSSTWPYTFLIFLIRIFGVDAPNLVIYNKRASPKRTSWKNVFFFSLWARGTLWILPFHWLREWGKFTNLPTHAMISPGLITKSSMWRSLNVLPKKLTIYCPFYRYQVNEQILPKRECSFDFGVRFFFQYYSSVSTTYPLQCFSFYLVTLDDAIKVENTRRYRKKFVKR